MLSLQYIAGFFDGEGCVHFTPDGRVQVGITQQKPEVLYMIQKQFGGGVRISDRACCTYRWGSHGKKVTKKFLIAILPYSVVKKTEIELGLEAVELIRDNNLGCTGFSLDELEKRKEFAKKLQRLRPTKLYTGKTAKEKEDRQKIKEQADYKCFGCGKNLKSLVPREQIIKKGNLYCRKCHVSHMTPYQFKSVSKEQIEGALSRSKNMEEARKIVDLSKAQFYHKRKKFGMVRERQQ